MAELLTSKQDMEERCRQKDLEIKDLRRLKSELEHGNHEQSLNIQKVRLIQLQSPVILPCQYHVNNCAVSV